MSATTGSIGRRGDINRQAKAIETMLDSSGIALAIYSPRLELLFANQRTAELFGVPPMEMNGWRISAHFSDHEQWKAMLARVEAGTRASQGEVRFMDRAGRTFRSNVTMEPTRFGDQPAFAIWISDPPATGRSFDAVRVTFEFAPLPMLLCDGGDGTLIWANRRARELSGVGSGTHARELSEFIGEAQAVHLLDHVRLGGFAEDYEVEFRTDYGETFWALVSGQAINSDEERRVLIGINDITERKHAEETLRRFFEAAPLPMVLCGTGDGKVRRLNRRALELFGTDDCAERHLTLDAFIGPFARKRFMDQLAGGGFIDGFEVPLTTGYGETLWGMLSGQLVRVAGDSCVLIGASDITERKGFEEELRDAKSRADEATQAKSVFLATMSHEIRTPMNGVLGMIDVLWQTELNWDQRQMMTVVKDSARALLAIIDDILDLTKIESGKLRLESVPFSLRETVESAVDLMSARAREHKDELAGFVEQAIPDQVVGDPGRLRQILLNLIGNAIKFTSDGSIGVTVSLLDKATDHVALRFEVTDSGIGMSAEQSAKLFQPYVQAEDSTARKYGGTGLGLSICRKLVDAMGGAIGVTSQPGAGSVFWFEIPLAVRNDIRAAAEADLSGLTLMLLDCFAPARNHMEEALTRAGASLIVCDKPRQALEMIRQVRTGAASIDLAIFSQGPELDAIKLIELLDNTGKFPTDKIILVSSQPEETLPPEVLSLGLRAILLNPMRQGLFQRAIARATGRLLEEVKAKPPEAKAARPSESDDQARTSGRLLLIAEDNATNRLVISTQLKRLGYAHHMVENGKLALEALQSGQYGLLITDCLMPEMDGYELTRAIRTAEKQTGKHLPIIALTANAVHGDAERCLETGMDSYLPKPVQIDHLDKELQKLLPAPPDPDQPAAAPEPAAAAPAPEPPPEPAPKPKRAPRKKKAKAAAPEASPTPEPQAAPEPAPPPAPVDEGEPLFHLPALAEILGTDDREVVSEILTFFLDSLPPLIDQLDAAVREGDPHTIRNVAHTAKGASRNAAVPRLASALEKTEKAAASGQNADFAALMASVREACGQTISHLRTFI